MSTTRDPEGQVWISLTTNTRWQPPDATGADPSLDIELGFAEVDGRLECVHVGIGSYSSNSDAPDPSPLRTSLIRRIPLQKLIDDALFKHTKNLRRWAKVPMSENQRKDLADRLGPAEASLGRAPGRPVEYDTDHFIKVADCYTKANMFRQPPTRAVQARFTVSYSTAAKWVAHARKLGLLPATTRGRANGSFGKPPIAAKTPPSKPRSSARMREIEKAEAREAFVQSLIDAQEAFYSRYGVSDYPPPTKKKAKSKLAKPRARSKKNS